MKLRKVNPVEVTYHHSLSADVSAATIREWHLKRNFSDIGYHFVIHPDGSLEFGRPLKFIGAHAKGRNSKTIGVCFTGDFRKNDPTAAQYETGKKLHKLLEGIYGDLKIGFHRTLYNPCPGIKFNRAHFTDLIKG